MTTVWILETTYANNKRQSFYFSTLEKAQEALEEEKQQAWGKREEDESEVYTSDVKMFAIRQVFLDDY